MHELYNPLYTSFPEMPGWIFLVGSISDSTAVYIWNNFAFSHLTLPTLTMGKGTDHQKSKAQIIRMVLIIAKIMNHFQESMTKQKLLTSQIMKGKTLGLPYRVSLRYVQNQREGIFHKTFPWALGLQPIHLTLCSDVSA